jgi:Tol biopolymer transport system component
VWLYYRRGGIWRVPTAGGAEQQVIDAPVGTFGVTTDRVYFDRGFGDYARPELYVHDLNTQETKLVSRFERRKTAGLSVSPDGRSILVALNDRQSSEILLVR